MLKNGMTIPLGIVVRKTPGATAWAQWAWKVVGVLPGAAPESWKVLRREGDAVEYQAGTVDLELWRSDTEAYLAELETKSPGVYVVMNRVDAASDAAPDFEVLLATLSPYEAQDYADTGEDIVEKVPMPAKLRMLLRGFVEEHHRPEEFVKRRRDKKRVDLIEDGVGDARIDQASDVYRAPTSKKRAVLQ